MPINAASILLLVCISTPFAASASGSDSLPEIVVVGDLREQDELSSMTSVTVVGADDLRSKQAEHLEEALGFLPNVNFASGTNRARFFQIRGIGERSQFASPQNPSVGVLIDGIDFTGAADVAGLLDLDQLEVLRGPQGTRYGASGLAGLVYIKSNDPMPERSADLALGYGNYGRRTGSLVLNYPFSDRTAIRLAADSRQTDGYYDNTFLNREDTNGTDEQSLIVKVRHETPKGTLSWVTRAANFDNGYDAFSLDNLRSTLSDEPGRDQHKMVAHGATWQQPLMSLELKVQLSHASSELLYGYDEDWAYPEIHPFSYSSTDEYARDRNRSSFTLSLSSSPEANRDTLSWTGGIHLANQNVALTRTYTFLPGPYISSYDYQTRSLFGEISLPVSARMQVVAGARFERRSQSFSDSESVQFRPEDSLWSGRLGVQWNLAAQAMAYLGISRGVKSGGFNTDGTLPAMLRRFDPESLIEVEGGLRAKLVDDRLQLKAALFRADRTDQQIKSSRVTQREDGSTEFIDYLGNAAEGVNQGLEIEARFLVSERWQGRFALGLLDTKFDRFINEFGEDYGGREQAHAPRYTAQGTLNYSADRFEVQIGIEGKDDFYFSDRHNVRSSDYLVVNVSSTLHFDAFDLSIWGRNLTDETIHTRGFGSFGNDPRKDYATEPYFQFGEPRVWGMTLTAQLAGQ